MEEIIAAFDEFDLCFHSGVNPDAYRSGWVLAPPNMLVRASWGAAYGVSDVNIGYSGTGPRNAEAFLEDLGVPDDEVREIIAHRFARYVPGGRVETAHGYFGVQRPVFGGSALVARLGREDLLDPREVGAGARGRWRQAGESGDSVYQACLRVLGHDDRPAWLRGERVARVFLDADAAQDQGFDDDRSTVFGRPEGPYRVIIEQGRMQLWLPIYNPTDPTEILSEEAYTALDEAGLRPAKATESSPVGTVLAYVSRAARRRRRWIDFSTSGQGALRYVPVPPTE